MKQVLKIINQLENTSSTKEKQKILADNKDNVLLKKILFYTYNENKYGMTRDTINPNLNPPSQPICDMFSLLDCLATNNINESLRQEVNNHLGMRSEEEIGYRIPKRIAFDKSQAIADPHLCFHQ